MQHHKNSNENTFTKHERAETISARLAAELDWRNSWRLDTSDLRAPYLRPKLGSQAKSESRGPRLKRKNLLKKERCHHFLFFSPLGVAERRFDLILHHYSIESI